MPRFLLSFALLSSLIGSLRVARADDPSDTPSTLSPRATKDRPPEENPVPAPEAPRPTPQPRQPTPLELAKKRIDPALALRFGRAKEQRTTGLLLTGVGSAALLASTAVWTVLAVAPPQRSVVNLDPGFGYKVGGIVTLVVGGVFAVPGAIVWALADRRVQKLSAEVAIPSDRPLYQ